MKVIFFCGHLSPYGRAHLEPILKSKFDVTAVVLATNERWAYFRSALSGKPIQNLKRQNVKQSLKHTAKQIIARVPGNFHLKRRALQSISHNHRLGKETTQFLDEYGSNVNYEFDINSDDFVAWVEHQEPDLIISAAYPQIFRRPLLRTPNIGCINSHPSLLPRCRGAHPIFWAIASGEKRSGVTVHYMTEVLDAGDIIAQRGFDLKPSMRYRELYSRIVQEMPKLVEDVERFFLSGKRNGRPQAESRVTFFRNDREIHRRIFFSKLTALEIGRLVRACDGDASFYYCGELIQVIRAVPLEKTNNVTNNIKVPTGTIVDYRKGGLYVTTKRGIIRLDEISARRKRIRGADILQQMEWEIGMVIGN